MGLNNDMFMPLFLVREETWSVHNPTRPQSAQRIDQVLVGIAAVRRAGLLPGDLYSRSTAYLELQIIARKTALLDQSSHHWCISRQTCHWIKSTIWRGCAGIPASCCSRKPNPCHYSLIAQNISARTCNCSLLFLDWPVKRCGKLN